METSKHSIGHRPSLFAAAIGLLAGTAMAAVPVNAPKISSQDLEFFETKIRPVLIDKCYKCHSREADKVKGGLLLDTRDGLLHGGNTGPALEPGKPAESLLMKAISHADEDLKMPPKDADKLNDQQVADFNEWIRRGGPDPRVNVAKGSTTPYGGVGKQHWAFQPVKKPAVPTVKEKSWPANAVDQFVLAKLEANDMAPSPAAEKRTLIRRVTFDLIGLPPTEKEIQAFLNDDAPDAFSKVVDRLLASPHYGERWARYWLDVARYSDTKGDAPRRNDVRYPHAWTYRDYVIDAFNRDKPYNEFILEQLAADRLVINDAKGKSKEQLAMHDQSRSAALGFLTLGNQFDGNKHDVINDRIDVTTKAFLGLTVACARCHDHKFDPIPTKDYYSLYGVFANTYEPKLSDLPTVRPVPKTTELQEYMTKIVELEAREEELKQERASLRKLPLAERREKGRELQRKEGQVQRELGDLEANHPAAPPRANVLMDVGPKVAKDYPVLIRGEAQNRGEVVPRRFLEVLSPDPKKRPAFKNGSGRLELAQAIASPGNPLTARVLVNRIWQEHFGAGFVATPDDLGNMSSPPTHPELLDYLAATFVENGWSVKKLHRQIVLSRTYQQSSENNSRFATMDPQNTLLWRANLRRLDFEELHDALIAVSGALDPKIGGRSVPIGSAEFASRRAVYTYIDRRNPAELLTQFDFPNPDVPSGRRYETIVPQQSLFLMNSPMVIETARKLVERPEFAKLTSDEARVNALYLAVYQRPATAAELKLCLNFVQATPANAPMPRLADAAGKNDPRAARRAEKASQAQLAKAARTAQPEPAAAAFKTRAPMDAWTKLAHALFQTNEAMFVN